MLPKTIAIKLHNLLTGTRCTCRARHCDGWYVLTPLQIARARAKVGARTDEDWIYCGYNRLTESTPDGYVKVMT